MFRQFRLVWMAAMTAFAGCGPGGGDAPGPGERSTLSPSPLALEFADTYDVVGTPTNGLVRVMLAPTGAYVATLLDGTIEQGRWCSAAGIQLPVTLYLKSAARLWTAQVLALDGTLSVSRHGDSVLAKSEHPVGPNESLCDESGGRWTDDDVDPQTGLYCLCETGLVYVPSQGGCTIVS